jgi:hypothetical protein
VAFLGRPWIVASGSILAFPWTQTSKHKQTSKQRRLAIDTLARPQSLPANATATTSLVTSPLLLLALALFAPHSLLIVFFLLHFPPIFLSTSFSSRLDFSTRF